MKDIQSKTQRPRFQLLANVQRIAPFANGLLLLVCLMSILFIDSSRSVIDDLESLNQAQRTSTDLPRSPWLSLLLVGLIVITFLAAFLGLWRGRPESRSLRAWLVFIFLVCGWLATWLGRQDLYWSGHAWRVSSEVSTARQLGKTLDEEWPSGDGDYPELGFVLGYPKENPVSLMLAGEPVPIGKLRIVAIEKSKDGQTLRFQLANPNHDTWLVRTNGESELAEFTNGFDSRYTASRTRQLSDDWFLIRYDT